MLLVGNVRYVTGTRRCLEIVSPLNEAVGKQSICLQFQTPQQCSYFDSINLLQATRYRKYSALLFEAAATENISHVYK